MMLDGRVVSDRLLRISPDTAHTIVVRAPGYRPAVWSEALGVGDTARWSPTLQRIESSVTTVPHAADTLAGAVFQAATGEVVLAERTDSAPRSAAIGAQDTLLAEPALGSGIGPSPPADSAPASVVVERSDSVGARAGGSVSDTASRDTSTRDTVALRIGTATGDLAVGRTAESKPQAAIDTMVRGTPLPRPIMPRPRAAAVDPAVAREQIQGGVDEYLQALRAGDADRISRLFKSTTDADERNERHLVNLMEMRNARLAVAQQQIVVPRILAHGATVEFRAKLTWKTPFGATRSQWIPFLAEFQQTGETWRLTRARIVGAPDLD